MNDKNLISLSLLTLICAALPPANAATFADVVAPVASADGTARCPDGYTLFEGRCMRRPPQSAGALAAFPDGEEASGGVEGGSGTQGGVAGPGFVRAALPLTAIAPTAAADGTASCPSGTHLIVQTNVLGQPYKCVPDNGGCPRGTHPVVTPNVFGQPFRCETIAQQELGNVGMNRAAAVTTGETAQTGSGQPTQGSSAFYRVPDVTNRVAQAPARRR